MQYHVFGRKLGQSFVMLPEGMDKASGARSSLVMVKGCGLVGSMSNQPRVLSNTHPRKRQACIKRGIAWSCHIVNSRHERAHREPELGRFDYLFGLCEWTVDSRVLQASSSGPDFSSNCSHPLNTRGVRVHYHPGISSKVHEPRCLCSDYMIPIVS